MMDLEVKVLSEMAKLEYNLLIKDDLRELIIEGEFSMAWEMAYNHTIVHASAFPEYRITRPTGIINAINPTEERRKQEHNRQFKFDNHKIFKA